MRTTDKTFTWTRFLLAALVALSLGSTCDGDDGGPTLEWYQTCGDPVCGGYTPGPDEVECTDQAVGDPCALAGESCAVPGDQCNVDLLCTDADPATNCPISRRSAKRDIRYMSQIERTAIVQELLQTRLATYRYKKPYTHERGPAARHLGFIIDDLPEDSPAVLPSGERVDLYGYTSMAVAAIQSQAEEIAALRADIQSLQGELAHLRAQQAHPAVPTMNAH